MTPTAPHIVFDLDDTLIQTSVTFNRARDQFGALMAARGIAAAEAIETLLELDLARIEAEGFGRGRFPVSLRDAYLALCARHDLVARAEDERAAENFGHTVFTTPPEVFPSTHEVLRHLRGEGCRLFLLTKGDFEVQQFRIDGASLRGYFDAIHVFPRKDLAELQEVLHTHRLPRENTWVIGDGMRSDINPAMAEGLHAILVGDKRWIYEDVAPTHDGFHRVSHVGEVPPYVLGRRVGPDGSRAVDAA